jgi:hypothetical protein
MMGSLRCGVLHQPKENIMKASTLAVALAIALASTTALAADADRTSAASTQATPAAETEQTWYQAGEFKVQAEQSRAKLGHQGFPQYVR